MVLGQGQALRICTTRERLWSQPSATLIGPPVAGLQNPGKTLKPAFHDAHWCTSYEASQSHCPFASTSRELYLQYRSTSLRIATLTSISTSLPPIYHQSLDRSYFAKQSTLYNAHRSTGRNASPHFTLHFTSIYTSPYFTLYLILTKNVKVNKETT